MDSTEPQDLISKVPDKTKSMGVASLVCFLILVLSVFVMFAGAPGGWAFGYGFSHLAAGFFSVLTGLSIAIIALAKGLKSKLLITSLIFNALSVLLLIPIIPLIGQVVGSVLHGNPPKDRIWGSVEANRRFLAAKLSIEEQKELENTCTFIISNIDRFNKKDAEDIEAITNDFWNQNSGVSEIDRGKIAIAKLKQVKDRHAHQK